MQDQAMDAGMDSEMGKPCDELVEATHLDVIVPYPSRLVKTVATRQHP
jgi:hypothetical protein